MVRADPSWIGTDPSGFRFPTKTVRYEKKGWSGRIHPGMEQIRADPGYDKPKKKIIFEKRAIPSGSTMTIITICFSIRADPVRSTKEWIRAGSADNSILISSSPELGRFSLIPSWKRYRADMSCFESMRIFVTAHNRNG
jgi:hypothetical protein